MFGEENLSFSSETMCPCEPGPVHQTRVSGTAFSCDPLCAPAPQTGAMLSCACFCFPSCVEIPFFHLPSRSPPGNHVEERPPLCGLSSPACPPAVLNNMVHTDPETCFRHVSCGLRKCTCHIPWSCVSSWERTFVPHSSLCP